MSTRREAASGRLSKRWRALGLRVRTLAFRRTDGTRVGPQLWRDEHWIKHHSGVFNKEKYSKDLITRKGSKVNCVPKQG